MPVGVESEASLTSRALRTLQEAGVKEANYDGPVSYQKDGSLGLLQFALMDLKPYQARQIADKLRQALSCQVEMGFPQGKVGASFEVKMHLEPSEPSDG